MHSTPIQAPDGLPDQQWHAHNSHDQCCQALAELIQQQLQQALLQRQRASLILSGGGTPAPLFDKLTQANLEWPRIDITLADERWVDSDSPQSNERMLRQHLLSGIPEETRFIALKGDELSAVLGQAGCEHRLQALNFPIDISLLGMGNDGHTASLFPDSSLLTDALNTDSDRRCWPMQAPVEPCERISLGAAPLASSRLIVLLIQGQEKYQTLQKALSAGDVEQMPIRAFLGLPQCHVFWSP